MELLFLGTGAADWNGPDERGEYRRNASVLLDNELLIDITKSVLGSIWDKDNITDVFLTHSHDDHYDPDALCSLAPCRVYAHESWAKEIKGEGLTVIPLRTGAAVQASGFTLTPLPSNHFSNRDYEITLHYLIEKDGRRLLYATDGAWLTTRENRLLGDKALDAVVFDATVGEGHEDDWRVFEHNTVEMIRIMRASMVRSGRLKDTTPVYLTHLSRSLHGTQAALEKQIESPLVVSFDGLKAHI